MKQINPAPYGPTVTIDGTDYRRNEDDGTLEHYATVARAWQPLKHSAQVAEQVHVALDRMDGPAVFRRRNPMSQEEFADRIGIRSLEKLLKS